MFKSVRGNPGFGFKKNEKGLFIIPYQRNSHEYNVMIGENVEIDATAHIANGSWRNTVIGDGTKIDGLVHVGHNCIIGKNCLLVSCVNLGGSCEIGDNCYLTMSVVVNPRVKIANNVTIGACSKVTRDITEPHTTWNGNPARLIHHYQLGYDEPKALMKVIGKSVEVPDLSSK